MTDELPPVAARDAPASAAARSRNPAGAVERVARIHELGNLLIERALDSRGILGVVPAHGGVLAFLFRQSDPVPIKDIVAFTGRAKSTVTGVVQTLERHGYVARAPDPADHRSWRIRLTPAGHRLRTDFGEISRHLAATVLDGLSPHEQTLLVDLLVRLEDNLAGELARAPHEPTPPRHDSPAT